ncbi:hypothetical protein ACWEO2_34000 [Nocardia sp. NPDC004278]
MTTSETTFDPARYEVVPPRTFEQLRIGEVFRAPSLTPEGDNGLVTTQVTVHNQRGDLVLSGNHTYLLHRTPSDAIQDGQR